MDRCWFLTWTTYGTWLPGDARGFVSPIRDAAGERTIHNLPSTPYDANVPAMETYSRRALKGQPIYLTEAQAQSVARQMRETAQFRGWSILAAAIMAQHVHLVVGVDGDPEPATLLASFKSYASRALNRLWPTPPGGTWWTESGSRRKLSDDGAIMAAVAYVAGQEHPLASWADPQWLGEQRS